MSGLETGDERDGWQDEGEDDPPPDLQYHSNQDHFLQKSKSKKQESVVVFPEGPHQQHLFPVLFLHFQ